MEEQPPQGAFSNLKIKRKVKIKDRIILQNKFRAELIVGKFDICTVCIMDTVVVTI